MHDCDIFAEAMEQLEVFVNQRYGAKRLTSKRAAEWRLPLTEACPGWIIGTGHHFDRQKLSLVLIPSEKFPYETPAVYVRPERA